MTILQIKKLDGTTIRIENFDTITSYLQFRRIIDDHVHLGATYKISFGEISIVDEDSFQRLKNNPNPHNFVFATIRTEPSGAAVRGAVPSDGKRKRKSSRRKSKRRKSSRRKSKRRKSKRRN